ncbi:MAG: DUF393 domain-containing protein [Phycisphaerales bacterium]|nr:DUF393 domain-containing protein [Phycisphaerales bacterium]
MITDSDHLCDPTIVYFDGWCTVCIRSAEYFRKIDNNRNLVVCVDLRSDDERIQLTGMSVEQLATSLHTRTPDGNIYSGPDAIRHAMSAMGKGRQFAWTKWMIIKPIVDSLYLLFARNRLRWFKKNTCESDACSIDPSKK